MNEDRVKLDAVPTGNNPPEEVEFPLPSLRKFLMPGQLVSVKTFEAATLQDLDKMINQWVKQTSSIVAVPSAPTKVVIDHVPSYLLTLSYVSTNEGVSNG